MADRGKILVTGSSGHLGEALVRVLRDLGDDVTGLDIKPSPYTDVTGDIADRSVVRDALAQDVTAVLHAATLHKPHVGSHAKQDFIDVNVTETLNLRVWKMHAPGACSRCRLPPVSARDSRRSLGR